MIKVLAYFITWNYDRFIFRLFDSKDDIYDDAKLLKDIFDLQYKINKYIGFCHNPMFAFEKYYQNFVYQVLAIWEENDEEFNKIASNYVFNPKITAKISQEIVKSDNDLSHKIWKLISHLDNPLYMESFVNVTNLKKLIPYIELNIVSAIILPKFYVSNNNTDVDKVYAKELVQLVIDNFPSKIVEHLKAALETWASNRLIAIGSVKQHVFLTFW